MDTLNKFMVSVAGGGVVLLNPPHRGQVLTPDEAITLAAWLVALGDGEGSKFKKALEAVTES